MSPRTPEAILSLPLRAASPAAAGPFSIRIVLDWRRPHPAVDASCVSRADRACLTVRRDKRLCLTDIADAGSPVLFVFLDMPAAARRGLGRRNRSKIRNGPVADLGPRQDRSTLWLLGVQIQRAVQIECAQPAIITLLRLWNPQSRCSEGLPDWRAAHCGI
jgi:hypothetical protein